MPPIKVVGKPIGVTSNVDPAPMMYIFLTTPYTSPFKGRCIERVYTHTTQTSTFISFLTAFQNFLRSDRPKTRRSKRLSSICHRPPTNPVGADDVTKVVNNSELQMEFCGNFVFNSLNCRSDFFFSLQPLQEKS